MRSLVILSAAAAFLGCQEPQRVPLPVDLNPEDGHWFAHRWDSEQARLTPRGRLNQGAIVDGSVHLLELQPGRRTLAYENADFEDLARSGVPLPVLRAWRLELVDDEPQWQEQVVSEGPGGFDRLRHGLREASPAACIELGGCAVIADADSAPSCVPSCTPDGPMPPRPPTYGASPRGRRWM